VATMVSGRTSPTEKLGRAWKHVLFNQFHDIMAGSSLPDAYEDARDEMGGAIHAAAFALNAGQQAVSWMVDTQGPDQPVFFFNNQARPFEGVVETEDFGEELERGECCFTDNSGKPIPCQAIDSHSRAGRNRGVVYLSLPSLGHKLLRIRETKPTTPSADLLGGKAVNMGAAGAEQGPWWMENDQLRVQVDSNGLLSIRDKKAGREVFNAPAATPLIIEDKSDTWSHGVFTFDKVIDRFRKVSVRLIEKGPVRGGIRVAMRYADSLLTLDYLLGAGENHVEVRGEIDWRDAWKVVKLAFPVNAKTDRCTVEIPYGTIERPTNNEEEPMLQWVDVSDAQAGCTVANNGKYSHSVTGSEIRITLLRSPAYAFHDPYKIDYAGDNRIVDRGIQSFRLSLIPHGGDWRAADGVGKARQLNFPPSFIYETFHTGKLPAEMSGVTCSAPGVEVSVIKGAEDGKALVVRACEWFGKTTDARIELPLIQRQWQATFAPGQVKTFLVPDDKSQPVREVNMLEE
jgi:alpha-mannosidase